MGDITLVLAVVLLLIGFWFCMLFWGAFDDLILRAKRVREARKWDQQDED